MRAFSGQVGRHPSGFMMTMVALDFAVGDTYELVVSAGEDPVHVAAVLSRIGQRYAPNLVTHFRPPTENVRLAELAPFVASQVAKDGKTTFYLCKDFACQAPTHDLETVLRQID